MSVWVAYAANGDLVATADTYASLVRSVGRMGWDPDDLWIGRATP
jgi:hypothetical protein